MEVPSSCCPSESYSLVLFEREVFRRVVENQGVELIVHGGVSGSRPIYAQTIRTTRIEEFEEIDFQRPFQDSTRTLSPRLARLLVNLSLTRNACCLLDPFCGLGTVLQEALLSGVSIVGVDRDQLMVRRAKENLAWLRHKYNITKELHDTVFAFDARRISKARMPKVDAIATEPILLPIFESNPGVLDARKHIEKAREMYEKCMYEFATILSRKNQRVAIVSPVLIDSFGSPRTFDISEVARSAGLMPFTSSTVLSNLIEYPVRLESMKKRTIQRNVYVFYLK